MTETYERHRIVRMLLSALVFVFGFQAMRFLFASLTWYLRDTIGIGVINLVPISLAPFLLGASVPILYRFIGAKRALWLGVVVLVTSRLVLQVSPDPGVDYWAASLATMAFVGLVPLLFGLGRSTFVGGILLAFALDSAIKGLGLSLDLAYQPGWRASLAVLALGLALVWALLQMGEPEIAGTSWLGGLRLLAVAPFLFFELLIFQSSGWASAVTGVSGPASQLVIALLNVVALLLVSRTTGSPATYLISVAVVSGAAFAAEGGAVTFGILGLLAVPAGGLVLAGIVPEPRKSSIGISSSLLTSSLVLFLVFGLAYYLPLDLSLGFTQASVRLAGAGLLLGFGLLGLISRETSVVAGRSDWMFAGLAALLPAVALVGVLTIDYGPPPEEHGVVRFMSYNVHSAFNVDGNLDVEAIALVIEDSQADVIGLQEVPRGRLLSGTTDLLTLLQLRLGFEHVAYFGTTDPVWGNAVLSRYPIVEINTEYLPLVDTPLRRGYLGATVDIDGLEVVVISTHLQHVNDQDVHDKDPEADLFPVHLEQVGTILDTWAGQAPAVLMGDFNARPDWAQIDLLINAGWVDSWPEAGVGNGYTSNAADPRHRIDYVFHTSDLQAVDAGVFQSTASDHFPVVVDISLN